MHAPGRTVIKAERMPRHPLENNGDDSIIKTEELWHNWFTVNETHLFRITTFVSTNQNRDRGREREREREAKQLIAKKLAPAN